MAEAPTPTALRANVCAVLTDEARARVLVFRRVDGALGAHRWQFPQGGLDPGEEPHAGLLRELREEIGTDAVELLAELPRPIVYLYPPDLLAHLRAAHPDKARYGGQAQRWFLARLREGTAGLHFDHQPPEFDAFEWVAPAEAVERVVSFKQAAYREALTAFGLLSPVGR
jgi:putative (di)nucleoside polyphosphate hydrolase